MMQRMRPFTALALGWLVAGCGSDAASPDASPPDAGSAADAAVLDAPAPVDLAEAAVDLAADTVDLAEDAQPKTDVPCDHFMPAPFVCVQFRPLGNPCDSPVTGFPMCVDGRWQCPSGSTFGVEGCLPHDAGSPPGG
jgi:hypothetical protein